MSTLANWPGAIAVPGALALAPAASLENDYAFITDPARRALALHAFTPHGADSAPALTRPRRAAQREDIVFYDFPSSPFCIKVRAMLLWKGLAFDAVDALQPRHWLALQRHGSGKVPALTIAGRFVFDSTDIAAALDQLVPEQPLLPTISRAHALCHAIEEWADESLYFVGLHYLWRDPRSRGQAAALFGRGLLGRGAYAWYRWRVARQVRAQGTGRKTTAHIELDLHRHLNHADALVTDWPFLLGHQPRLCDFALFGQLVFLLRADASRPLLERRPKLLAYVERMRALGR